jgi:23S rRNA pseudouridine2605 synthase
VPKKTGKQAATAAASAGEKQAAKLEIELIAAPELEPKAKKTRAKKVDAARGASVDAGKPLVDFAPEPIAVSGQAAPGQVAPEPAAVSSAAPPAKKKRASTKTSVPSRIRAGHGVLKGLDFSRAVEDQEMDAVLAAEGRLTKHKIAKNNEGHRTGAPKSAKVTIKDETARAAEAAVPAGASISDPIGDVSDAEPRAAEGAVGLPPQSESEALAETLAEEIESNEAPEYIPKAVFAAESAPPAKLERLQKILARAGIASRRRAEEMIVEGRVIVNGQLVTQLGAKADLARDHIRVDGKLIAGAEHHRYFVLNKPRGFVTTASDPEGRPTVMQLFEKMPLRLYPVGRLDYLSEGLLLVTNDGELANQLTRASLGVEKTYLVKVAGKPTEEELDRLRTGVSIERGKPGTERVGTAPAQIRKIRHGDNPWFEVVLIEGRNRELRKMFEQIGHFVEKIRRVGYGPLVLDVEPGKFRELTSEEVKALHLTVEGKLKPRRLRASQMLPKDAGRAALEREAKRNDRRPAPRQSERPGQPPRRGAKPGFKPRFDNRSTERFGGRSQYAGKERGDPRSSEPRRSESKPFREREGFQPAPKRRFEDRGFGARPQQRSQEPDGGNAPRREFRPRGDKPEFSRGGKPAFNRGGKPEFKPSERPAFRPGGKPEFKRTERPAFSPGGKPEFKREGQPAFKRSSPGAPLRGGQSSFRSEKPAFDRGSKPAFDRSSKPAFERGARPAFKRSERPAFKRDDRPPFKRSGEMGGNFEGSPSRPPGRTFGARPAGQPGARPSGGRSSGGTTSGRKFGAGAPRKPGSRPGGKFKPRGDRKRY